MEGRTPNKPRFSWQKAGREGQASPPREIREEARFQRKDRRGERKRAITQHFEICLRSIKEQAFSD